MRKKNKLLVNQNEKTLGQLLVLPLFLLVFGLMGYPFINTIYISLTNKRVGYDSSFIGFKNYIRLFQDPTYWMVLKNTFVYMILAVGVKLVIGMILALTLNEDFKGRAIVRMLLLIPWALPGMVAAMTWKWMYNDTFGIINSILKNIGLIEVSIPWLSSKHLTLYSVIIVNIWRGIPFFIFSLLGGLQTIDGQLYEAAKIDGANMIRRFWSITVPSILPVISITTMLSSIWTFNDFENIWLITGGGPLNSSSVVATYTYQIAFQYNEMAQAVSVAVSIMPILIVMILFASKRIGKED
jgi:multiple sugar transport system permease protein